MFVFCTIKSNFGNKGHTLFLTDIQPTRFSGLYWRGIRESRCIMFQLIAHTNSCIQFKWGVQLTLFVNSKFGTS